MLAVSIWSHVCLKRASGSHSITRAPNPNDARCSTPRWSSPPTNCSFLKFICWSVFCFTKCKLIVLLLQNSDRAVCRPTWRLGIATWGFGGSKRLQLHFWLLTNLASLCCSLYLYTFFHSSFGIRWSLSLMLLMIWFFLSSDAKWCCYLSWKCCVSNMPCQQACSRGRKRFSRR